MAKPKIDAKEALDAIRAGADDRDLMKKYGISAKGLQSLFSKLVRVGAISVEELENRASESRGNITLPSNMNEPNKSERGGRVVNAHQAAVDVKSGMSDADLMEKFKLSAKGLQNLFDQLVVEGLLTVSDITRRSAWVDSSVDLIGMLKDLGMDRTPKRQGRDFRVVTRCPACAAPQTMEFDECPICGADLSQAAVEATEKVTTPAWLCPACGRPQDRAYDECPVCGVIVAKFERGKTKDRN